MRYWYFVPTLPGFLFTSPPPMREEDFLEKAEKYMEPEDFAELRKGPEFFTSETVPPDFRSSLLHDYVTWERSMRNELSILRCRTAGLSEVTKYVRPIEAIVATSSSEAPSDPLAQQAQFSARRVFEVQDPLLAEQALEHERWNCLDELARSSYFDLDFLIAYYLKLRIVTRLAYFDQERGMAAYKRLYNDILGSGSNTAQTATSGDIV
ncbi:MAG TPA: DUF2764 family protein [Spirochaetales bacterium]|nr:DUF2764 family protein [Spirochaetales bacterium]